MKKPFPAYNGDQPYIFVSYSHEDSELVYPELIELKAAHFNVWYDEGISPGTNWRDELAQRLATCAVFLFYISPRSSASANCAKEVNFALGKNRSFLNVFLEPTILPPGLEFSLSDLQAIEKNQFNESDYRSKLDESLTSLLPNKEERIGKHEIICLGDHNAHFTSYLASQENLSRDVSLYVLSQQSKENSTTRSSLLEVARFMGRQESSRFITVHTIEEKEDASFVVTDSTLVTLETVMHPRLGGTPLFYVLRIALEISQILKSLHEQHRCLTLFHSELFQVNRRCHVSLAFPALFSPHVKDLTEQRYASPEEWRGESKPTIAANCYALGLFLYELIVGKLPYYANTKLAEREHDVEATLQDLRTTVAFRKMGKNQPTWRPMDGLGFYKAGRGRIYELLDWMLEPDAGQRCQYLFQNRNPQPSDSLKLCKYLENALNDAQFRYNLLRHDSAENIQFLEQLADEFEREREMAVRKGRTVPQGYEPERWEPDGDSQ